MAEQDKTDFYWNGVLSGAVNNLYYDLINVDVVHVPYATTHRNSSFFLKTRPGYLTAESWYNGTETSGREATDVKIIWDERCDKTSGTAYVLGRKGKNKAIFGARISDGCVGAFFNCTAGCTPTTSGDIYDECPDMNTEAYCGDWKLFTTNYVKGLRSDGTELAQPTGQTTVDNIGVLTGIQINKYTAGTTIGLFSDEYVENDTYAFTSTMFSPGKYLLVYDTANGEGDGFAGQVRMITGRSDDGMVMVDAPRVGFKVIDTSALEEGEEKVQTGRHVSYAVFNDWGEVLGFTAGNKIYILPYGGDCKAVSPYNQFAGENTANIIGVAEANEKIFVLTDNGYVHYCSSNQYGGYDKFFIQDDMFAGVDKTAIVSYKDFVLAFGKRHISVGVPDEQNKYWTMYNQSTTIGTRSRYSYAEYDGDLLFISNDKRLLALSVSGTAGRYMLQHEDVGDMLNGKLATMLDTDEVFIGSDDNNLRIFVQTKPVPYVDGWGIVEADRNTEGKNVVTHVYKFDTLFKVWSEDHVPFLLSGASEGVYFGEDGLYIRRYSKNKYPEYPGCDVQGADGHPKWPYTTTISAYMIENENNGLDSHPLLFQLAKLNRLITTLGPGIYSNSTKIKITNYSKGIGYIYEFPLDGDGNDWLGLITSYYLGESLDDEDEEKLECLASVVQDSQTKYQATCTDKKLHFHTEVQKTPWCDYYREFLIQNHGVCINDKLYELAPTMPLVTSLGENQTYSAQIKIELIGGQGDIICFGGRLAELYLAPLGLTGPDGEYQLKPNTACR